MGVKGLWPLIHPAASRLKLKDLNFEYGFIRNHHKSRTLNIGVDASLLLDTFHAANRGASQHSLHLSDTTLTQLQYFLCQLSEAGINCVFFFDGPERSAIKEPDYHKHAKALIECFGYYSHAARGDAEAELAHLNNQGIIDAVLTKDSDVFPFGAQRVLVPELFIASDTEPKYSQKSGDFIVDVYDVDSIQNDLQLSRAGFVLIALLLQNDFDSGVLGIGPRTALGLAQCAHEIEFNTHLKLGSCSPTRAQIFRDSNFPSSRSLTTLKAFLMPAVNVSPAHNWPPRIPNVVRISAFCREHFNWPTQLALKKFHDDLWPAVIIRMLYSKFLAYNPRNSEILVPQLQGSLDFDNQGKPYVPTLSSIIQNRGSPKLNGKQPNDDISVTFTMDFFIQLTGLAASNSSSRTTRRMNVPVALISVAQRQTHMVKGLEGLLGISLHPNISAGISIKNAPGLRSGPHSMTTATSSVVMESATSNGHSGSSLKQKQNFITEETKLMHLKLNTGTKNLGVIELTNLDDED
ncbi:PIN domain-like protein [Lentinula aff. lateritia]|uniref:PIN domain-like protein n=1 Tax=Lentinula aff. lateritia TaxID=2804960 RepID=A0ACC1TI64_9AGAR|nr:PIN domain-like protein [Lentinula aff. lateritia]